MKSHNRNLFGQMLTVVIIIFSASVCSGQSAGNNQDSRQEKKERILAQKVAFITQELQLTPEEAQKFWPLYNEFSARKEEYAKARKSTERSAKQTGTAQLSDQQAEDLINAELLFEQQVLDLKKEYKEKYKAVIGIQKTVKLYQAEKDFNTYLLKQLKDAGKAQDNE